MNKRQKTSFLEHEDVGITEYLNNSARFHGIFKHRFSDFIVTEIDLNGNKVPFDPSYSADDFLLNVDKINCSSNQNNENSIDSMEQARNIFAEKVGMENLLRLDGIIEKLSINSADKAEDYSIVLEESQLDKENRKTIHNAVKIIGNGLLSSDTTANATIRIFSSKKDKSFRAEKKKELIVNFTLYKENKDTMDSVNLLSKLLRMNRKAFSFAGTKDKRGMTYQNITCKLTNVKSLVDLNKRLFGIRTSHFKLVEKELGLGDLFGNSFRIILREITEAKAKIEDSLTKLKECGFINYFGMQRFGNTAVPTHLIGIELLKQNYSGAVDLILNPKQGEKEDVFEAQSLWKETRNPTLALKLFPARCSAEISILTHFKKTGNTTDATGAIQAIPRELRLMYVHAFQSYVWNFMTSLRLTLSRSSLIKGDLIQIENLSTDDVVLFDPDNALHACATIYDVVLPLPGYSIKYPENELKDHYKQMLDKFNISMDNMKKTLKVFSLAGNYRKILSKTNDLSWEFKSYSHIDQDLVESPLKKPEDSFKDECPDSQQHNALQLNFDLPSSSYATMALRELLK